MKNFLTFGVIAVSLVFTAGCGLFNNGVPKDDPTMPNVPYAENDPSGFNDAGKLGRGDGFEGGKGGVSDWSKGADDKTLKDESGAVDADGWRLADPTGNRLNMPVIYFAYDSDVLVASEMEKVRNIAKYMGENPQLVLVLEGHCDQRGTEEYNRALGERRANAVRAALESNGVAANRMKTQSFGEDKPAVSGNDAAAWRQNRRSVPVPMLLPR